MKFLTRDLTANLSTKQLVLLSYLVLTAATIVGVAAILATGVAQIALTAVFLIGMVVTLRIAGPKDAKSFRLYRPATAAATTV